MDDLRYLGIDDSLFAPTNRERLRSHLRTNVNVPAQGPKRDEEIERMTAAMESIVRSLWIVLDQSHEGEDHEASDHHTP